MFRFERLWEEEVARVGLEKASVSAVVMRFQKTRLIVSFLSSIFFSFAVFVGPVCSTALVVIVYYPSPWICWNVSFTLCVCVIQSILVYEILNYAEKPGSSTVHGVGLCVALFISEFSKAFFASLLWAINLRTAVRMKGAFSMLAFKKIISLRTLTNISVGEVSYWLFFWFVDWLLSKTYQRLLDGVFCIILVSNQIILS